jgi:hypothetical protein
MSENDFDLNYCEKYKKKEKKNGNENENDEIVKKDKIDVNNSAVQENRSAFSMSYFRSNSPIVDRSRSLSPIKNNQNTEKIIHNDIRNDNDMFSFISPTQTYKKTYNINAPTKSTNKNEKGQYLDILIFQIWTNLKNTIITQNKSKIVKLAAQYAYNVTKKSMFIPFNYGSKVSDNKKINALDCKVSILDMNKMDKIDDMGDGSSKSLFSPFSSYSLKGSDSKKVNKDNKIDIIGSKGKTLSENRGDDEGDPRSASMFTSFSTYSLKGSVEKINVTANKVSVSDMDKVDDTIDNVSRSMFAPFSTYSLKGLNSKEINKMDTNIDIDNKGSINESVIDDGDENRSVSMFPSFSNYSLKGLENKKINKTDEKLDFIDKINVVLNDDSNIDDDSKLGLDNVSSTSNTVKKNSYYDLSFGLLYSNTSVYDSKNKNPGEKTDNHDDKNDNDINDSINDNDNKVDGKNDAFDNENSENDNDIACSNLNNSDCNNFIDNDNDTYIVGKDRTVDEKNDHNIADHDDKYSNIDGNAISNLHNDDNDIDSESSFTDNDDNDNDDDSENDDNNDDYNEDDKNK